MGANQPLSGQQLKQLTEAILAGFDRNDLEELLLLDLDVRLEHITGNDDLRKTVKDILDWAQKDERVGDLIQAMKRARPRSAAIAALAQMAAGQASTPPPAQETGPQLSATLALKMAYVPTAVVNLLKREQYPLVQVTLDNTASRPRQLSVETEVHGYSDPWANTVFLGAGGGPTATAQIVQRPIFIPEKLPAISTLRQVQIRVKVIELSTNIVQLVESKEVWMLPINSAPIHVKDETTGEKRDMLRFLGAFVTESEPSIKKYLKTVAGYRRHANKALPGYNALSIAGDSVRSQVRALYEALNRTSRLQYGPSQVQEVADSLYQSVRLPRQSLEEGLANCLEGALLYCSLLEAMGLQSALVWVNADSYLHAAVAWKEDPDKEEWCFLDTTTNSAPQGTVAESEMEARWEKAFKIATDYGANLYKDYKDAGENHFRMFPIRDLRAQGITPLE